MNRKKAVGWALGALAAMLVGAAAVLFLADLGFLKPQVERLVSTQLGRAFSVDGTLSVRIGRDVRISAENLRLANPAWSSQPNMLEVTRLEAAFPLRSLWRPPLLVSQLKLAGTQLRIESSADGASNLALFETGQGDAPARDAGAAFLLQSVDIHELRVTVATPERATPLAISVSALSQQQQPDGMLALGASGDIGGEPFHYAGQLGTLDALLAGRDVRYRGDGRFGPLNFTGEGRVDDLRAPRFPEFHLRFHGDDFAGLVRMLGHEEPAEGAFDLVIEAFAQDGLMNIDVNGQVAGLDIRSRGTTAGIADFSSVAHDLSISGPRLGVFTRLLGLGDWPDEPFSIAGSLHRDGRLLELREIGMNIGTTRLALSGRLSAFPNLNQGTARLTITGDDIAEFRRLVGFDGPAEGAFVLDVSLDSQDHGGDSLVGSLRTNLGQVDFESSLGQGPDYLGSTFSVAIAGASAKAWLDGVGVPGFTAEPFALDCEFEVAAEGLRFAAGSLFTLNDDRLDFAGLIGYRPLESGTSLTLAVRGNDLSQFAPVMDSNLPLPATGYALQGGLRIDERGFTFDRIEGVIGENHVSVHGVLSRAAAFAGTELEVSTRGPNLERLIADSEAFDIPAVPFEVTGRIQHDAKVLKVDQLKAQLGQLEAHAEVDIDLPLAQSSGRFDVQVSGPDLGVLMPETFAFQPTAQAFTVTARGAAGKGTWRFDAARARLGEAVVALTGVLDGFPDFSSTDLSLSVRVPDLSALGLLDGRPLPAQPLELDSRFDGTTTRFALEELVLRTGESDLKGRLLADFAGLVPEITLDAEAGVLDLAAWSHEADPSAEEPASKVGEGRLLPDYTFPMAQLRRANGTARVRAGEVRLKRRTFSRLALDVRLQDGSLVVDQLHGEGLRGALDVTAALVPVADGMAEARFKASASGLLLNLSRDVVANPDVLPALDTDIELVGQGAGSYQALGNANGHLVVTGSAGVIPNSLLSALDAGLLEQVFAAILPVKVLQSDSNLQCFAARLVVENGVVRTDPGVSLVTDKVQMISTGTVNLATTALDLSFETHPTKAFQANVSEVLVNPFVKITGTIARPQLSLNAPKALLYSGAAIGTGGLSILAKGLLDRMKHGSDPCERFMEMAKGEAG